MALRAGWRQRAWMARKRRIDETGLIYHVWANGVTSLSLLRDADDRDFAVRLLRETVELFEWSCLEYVFMTTHYHVVLRLNKPTLSSGFHYFNLRYALYFNRRYGKRGHVFESRFQSKILEGPFDQLEVARYVARNPVKAAICERAEDYQWSGYGSTVGLFRDDRIVDLEVLFGLIGGRSAYAKYVNEPDARKRWGQVWARPRGRKISAKGSRAAAR